MSDPLWLAALQGANSIFVGASDFIDWDNRVLLSAGTCVESHVSYTPGSVVPIQQWRRISGEEKLLFSDERDPSRHVGVHALDAEIWLRLKVACGAPSASNDDRRGLLTDLLDHLALSVAHFGDETHILGFNRSVAEHFTLTRDQRLPRVEKIGLHIDSWDGGGVDGRAERTQRICINLGRTSRYFLFVNLPIMQMMQNDRESTKQTISRFFHAHPI
jgi:hypothetical protein